MDEKKCQVIEAWLQKDFESMLADVQLLCDANKFEGADAMLRNWNHANPQAFIEGIQTEPWVKFCAKNGGLAEWMSAQRLPEEE